MSTEPDTTATLGILIKEISVHSGAAIALRISAAELVSA